MEMTNSTTPLETVQIISMFSYLNTLSDFLFANNFLNETNLYQPIPVVNALYHYFIDDYKTGSKILDQRKTVLVRELIKDSDLYGSKEYETPDEVFVNVLFKHIITSLVFDKFTNIYGFLARIVHKSSDLKLSTLYERILTALSEEKFQNDYGPDSTLDPLAILKILQDFIFPLFPKPRGNLSLISVDYIYSQAGAIFFLSSETSPIITPTVYKKEDPVLNFNTYVATAHAVEELAFAGKIDKSALRIFALPALLYYVHSKKDKLRFENVTDIIYGTEAYELLFSYLSKSFQEIKKAQNNDHRYQFYLAVSNFKNRTTLGREIIKREYQFVDEESIEQEVTKFKNNPDSYKYSVENRSVLLPDLNLLYQEQVNDVAEKFFLYEKESIRESFDDRAKSLEKAIISKGLIRYYFDGAISQDVLEMQLIKESDDLFRVYFPENGRVAYYALIRKDNDVSLIQEADDPEIFRDKLGLSRSQELRENFFPIIKKRAEDSFDTFITRIAEERAREFKKSLNLQGYDQTRTEWWKEFGLSLIPFYLCSKEIQAKELDEAAFACSLDLISLVPVVGEIESIFAKFTTAITKSVFSLTETTLESVMLKMTLREALTISGTVLIDEAAMVTKKMFKDLGVAFLRFLDPGFELVFALGKGGLRSILRLMNVLENYPISLKTVRRMLEKSEKAAVNPSRRVGTTVFENVYVKSLSDKGDSGYGFKFVHLPNNKIAEVRRVREYEEEVAVVFDRVSKDEIIYKEVNPETGKIQTKNLHLILNDLDLGKRSTLQTKYPLEYSELPRIRLQSFHDSKFCGSLRFKRGLNKLVCLRNILKQGRALIESRAVNYAREVANLPEDSVRAKLRKYVFPGSGEMQLNFVKDWADLMQREKKDLPPAWSANFEIKDPELFNRLKYADRMDKPSISNKEAGARLAFYPKNPETKVPPSEEAAIYAHLFEVDKAYESVTFEDYYALRNYMDSGYERIDRDTIEAKCMKEALYRLAIRQSDDPIENYATTLFRGETRHPEVVEKIILSKGEMQFNRFTSASSSEAVAALFQFGPSSNVKIMYEMKFSGEYFRALVQNVVRDISEEETVLLPGSKFRIDGTEVLSEFNEDILKVKMTFLHDANPKHEWYKKIMDELEKLKKNEAPRYEIDFPLN